jgi:Flp pilus assembly pilin Flp
MNMLAPFGFGDIISRTFFLNSEKRYEAIGSLLLNRTSQFIPTMIFGLISVVFIASKTDNNLWLIAGLSLIIIAGLITFLARIKTIHNFIQTRFNSTLKLLLGAFRYYNNVDLIGISLLSTLRYFTFSIQFLLVFIIFEVNLPIHILLMCIFWIFLIKTLTPSLSIITDLAIRELSAVFYFSFWSIDQTEIALATLMIWFVNIIIPAILGIFFIPNLKFFRNPITESKD